MGQENGNERGTVTEITGGNVVDILMEYNENKLKSPQDVVEDDTQVVATEKATTSVEEAEVVAKAELTDAEKQWIIDGKFENTEEGIQALSKSYRELQGEYDRKTSEYGEKDKHYAGLADLEQWLIENPDAVHLIKDEYIGKTEGPQAPVKPDNFEPLDIGVEGTVTNDWFNADREYNRKLGALEAGAEVDKLRKELANEKLEVTQRFERKQSLVNAGLGEDEIEGYNSFMSNPDMSNDENLVKVYRLLTGNKQPAETTEVVAELNNPAVKKIVKTTSAAAVTGSNPVVTSQEETRSKFIAGMMSQGR